MKKFLIAALIIMIALQLAVPAALLISHFDTLNNGEEFRFKVAPVDPYDAFRGRYVAISVDPMMLMEAEKTSEGQGLYALLATDAQGFAYVTAISEARPENGPYIKGKYQYGNFTLPFERYYMEEESAPEAERVYGENVDKNAYIMVRVKNGNAVISGLYIDDMRIEEYLQKQPSL